MGGEIVNADSMQLYADLRLLTARPDPADLARAPHHLDGVADGAQAWSVGRWRSAAGESLAGIAARGRPAIVVGGTGLYFHALTRGLSDIPPVGEAERAAVEARYHAEGEEGFRQRLAALDPSAAARIERGDRQRLIRALAVAEVTGRSLTDWQAQTARPGLTGWRGLVLDPPRAALYARCDARLGVMVEHGALAEVAALTARGLDPSLPVMKALGAPEFAAHLRGEATLEAALAAARQSTRRYAKRQTTWFRNQTPDWPRLSHPDLTSAMRLLSGQTPPPGA